MATQTHHDSFFRRTFRELSENFLGLATRRSCPTCGVASANGVYYTQYLRFIIRPHCGFFPRTFLGTPFVDVALAAVFQVQKASMIPGAQYLGLIIPSLQLLFREISENFPGHTARRSCSTRVVSSGKRRLFMLLSLIHI